jgi:hypothetical protein
MSDDSSGRLARVTSAGVPRLTASAVIELTAGKPSVKPGR